MEFSLVERVTEKDDCSRRHPKKIAWLEVQPGGTNTKKWFVIFGGLAVVIAFAIVDP